MVPQVKAVVLLLGILSAAGLVRADEAAEPAVLVLGERLFLETRFAQSFATAVENGQDINNENVNDPVVNTTVTTEGSLPGPFAGKSMNCRACHLVDEQLDTAGIRTYNDFARRSPVPHRDEDSQVTAVRNAPPLVNSTLPRNVGLLLHFDTEFASATDLVFSTLTGRNYGWRPGELNQALVHIASVIREDNGTTALGAEFGGIAYQSAFNDPALPEKFRLDVSAAADSEVIKVVTQLIAAYVDDLRFGQDDSGNFNLSPYDVFLMTNGLPRQPRSNESGLLYSQRLLDKIEELDRQGRLRFVSQNPNSADGKFEFHDQAFAFGPQQLEGLRIFFRQNARNDKRIEKIAGRFKRKQNGSAGNCIACHQPPNFTDFRLHNTGTTQLEYDQLHGDGAFYSLHIPGLPERSANLDLYGVATEARPNAAEVFRAIPRVDDPRFADLGVWNIFADSQFPQPQDRIRRILCEDKFKPIYADFVLKRSQGGRFGPCSNKTLFPDAIARFKTPTLRDLSHSAPYMHNGAFDTLASVITFYTQVSELARAGALRNGAAEIGNIRLSADDIEALVAFLRALNEDYS